MIWDMAIVGAGPAGSRLASLLAKDMDIILLEEHESIGEPVQCGGLVSPKAVCEITRGSVICEIRDFTLHSPAGNRIDLHSESPRGIVIDRRLYDRSLAEAANDKGAKLLLGMRVANAKKTEEHIELKCKSAGDSRTIMAKLVVGADGPKSTIRKFMGAKPFELHYRGAQMIGRLDSEISGNVEMWIGNEVAPGFFAWKIPSEDSVRIGLSTISEESPMSYLKRFCRREFPDFDVTSKHSGQIPIGPLGPLSRGRVCLIGDAAGQTKPLTGGGVYLGKRAAELLAISVIKKGPNDEALMLYDERFRDEFEHDLSRAWLLRKIINSMSDSKLEKAIKLLSQPDIIEIMERSGDIDAPLALSPAILKRTPKLLQFAPNLLKGLI